MSSKRVHVHRLRLVLHISHLILFLQDLFNESGTFKSYFAFKNGSIGRILQPEQILPDRNLSVPLKDNTERTQNCNQLPEEVPEHVLSTDGADIIRLKCTACVC